jgi:hypothetical protein
MSGKPAVPYRNLASAHHHHHTEFMSNLSIPRSLMSVFRAVCVGGVIRGWTLVQALKPEGRRTVPVWLICSKWFAALGRLYSVKQR